MISQGTAGEQAPTRLESRKYRFIVEGSMPILDFDIKAGNTGPEAETKRPTEQHLTLEIYNPLSGEAFEAKFPKGRIEVDLDGSVTYFSLNSDVVNLSLFLGRNIQIKMDKKSGEVLIRTPAKILSVEKEINSKMKSEFSSPTNDSVKLKLE